MKKFRDAELVPNPNLGARITPPPGSVMDDRLIGREFYNANAFPITFTRQMEHDEYIKLSGKALGHEVVVVQPDTFQYLPHALFTASWPHGLLADEVIGHFNFGKEMGRDIRPNRDTLRKAKKHTGNTPEGY